MKTLPINTALVLSAVLTALVMVLNCAQAADSHKGFLYGRITMEDGTTYQGRLRFGDQEEAFWSDYFNGVKDGNPWADQVSPDKLTASRPVEILGLRIGSWRAMWRWGDRSCCDLATSLGSMQKAAISG